MGREDLYDETKKEFRKKELHKALDDLIKNGVEGYGVSQLRNLYGQAIRVGAPPELARMAPVIEQIIDVGTGAVKDKAKLMKFASEVTGDMLKMVAIKDPKALKDRFTRDELAMKAMTGDVLPSLIENAMSDKTMKDMIEKQVGKGLASKTKTEWFKGLPWDKILKILMIVLGVTIGFGVMAAHTGGVFGGGLPGTQSTMPEIGGDIGATMAKLASLTAVTREGSPQTLPNATPLDLSQLNEAQFVSMLQQKLQDHRDGRQGMGIS